MKKMKKLISLLLALVMVLSLSTVAFAAEGEGTEEPAPTYPNMDNVTLTKEYKLTNSDTTSPAETFSFSALTCTEVAETADGVKVTDVPVPTISSVEYKAGEAGGDKARKNITISLPAASAYPSVGIYTYTFVEIDNKTAGVDYRSDAIKLVVTVIEQNGKIRVGTVHTESASDGNKSAEFDNTYSAGSLSVKKNVTGIMGDKGKYFDFKVVFTAPTGKKVNSTISYQGGTDAGNTGSITFAEGETSKEVTFRLKDGETIHFTNIPYEVKYKVTETPVTDYTTTIKVDGEAKDAAEANIVGASTNVEFTNDKGGTVDTGVVLDTLPYVMILAVAAVCGMALLLKKRHMAD